MARMEDAGCPLRLSSVYTIWAEARDRALPASAARCSSSVPDVLRAISSARSSGAKGALAWWVTTQCEPEKSASTPSMPSSEVPDIRPMYSSDALTGAVWTVKAWTEEPQVQGHQGPGKRRGRGQWLPRMGRRAAYAALRLRALAASPRGGTARSDSGGTSLHSALACSICAAADSWMRMLAARRSNAGREAAETGAAASLWATMVCGSWCTPLTRNSKCRCGPVAQPVAPTAPRVWPCSTDCPWRTSMRLRWAYTVTCWLRCLTKTTLPKPFCTPANSTTPSPTVRTAVPVGAPGLQDGVQAHLEATGHARELHRRGEVRAAHAFAVQRVVGALGGTGFLEPDGLMGLAVIHELGAQNAATGQWLAIGFQRFVHHREAVALAQGAAKVDVAREQLGHLHGHGVGDVGRIGGGKQRTVDDAARQPTVGRHLGGFDARRKLVVARALDDQAAEVATVVRHPAHRQANQAVVVRGFCRHDAAGAAQHILSHRSVTTHECSGGRVGHAHALQQRLGGVAAAHLFGAEQRKARSFQLAQHEVFCQRFNGVAHHAHRQLGRVRRKGRHSECAAPTRQQDGCDGGGDAFGMLLDRAGQPVKQSRAGGGQAVNQWSIPRVRVNP